MRLLMRVYKEEALLTSQTSFVKIS